MLSSESLRTIFAPVFSGFFGPASVHPDLLYDIFPDSVGFSVSRTQLAHFSGRGHWAALDLGGARVQTKELIVLPATRNLQTRDYSYATRFWSQSQFRSGGSAGYVL